VYQWPYVDNSLERDVIDQLRASLSDKGSKGVIRELEKEIAERYEMPHCLFFGSATGAMHSLAYALGLQPGDEVLVPSYTFFASFSPLAYEGLTIVQCDIDENGQIDLKDMAKRVTPRTKAAVCTHMWGIPCDMDALVNFCSSHGIFLIEDGSHAHFARFGGRRVGTFGDVSVFSTNQKALTSGEGGFLLTKKRDIYEKAILFGHYNDRCKSELTNPTLRAYALTGLGLKYRATTLSVAVLRNQLRKFDEIEQRRRDNYARLFEAVASHPHFVNIVPSYDHAAGLYVFPFIAKTAAIRDAFLAECESAGCFDFDAPGSTKPLWDEPLFEDMGVGAGRVPFQGAQRPPSSTYPGVSAASDFYARVVKAPLWGYAGDEDDVAQCVERLQSFTGAA
jgi:dTDP-4-amino-4,6-dideoxygalactose transaminase